MKGNGKRARKTSPKTSVALRTPIHGNGKLQIGGTPGNPGGGRPPSVIRERCRGSFDARIPLLEQFADGVATERIEVPLSLVLDYADCPQCKGKLASKKNVSSATVSIAGKASPRAKDRIVAISELGKMGMTAGRVDQEEVRDRLAKTVHKITELADPATAEAILAALDRIWDPHQDESTA